MHKNAVDQSEDTNNTNSLLFFAINITMEHWKTNVAQHFFSADGCILWEVGATNTLLQRAL